MNKETKQPYGRKDRGISDTISQIKLKENRELLQRWANEKIANGGTLFPIATKLYTFKKIANGFDKPLEKLTKDDIVALLSKPEFNTLYYKKMLKQLYRWILNEKDPAIISWISNKKSVEEIKNQRPKITLTQEQASEILSKADNPMDRAWLEIECDNPNRPKDLENLKVKDVSINEYGVTLHFTSKTQSGNREIFLQNSRTAFLKFWETHPYKDDPEAPVFYNLNRQKYGQPLKWGGFNGRLRHIVNRTKLPEELKKKITLYTFRRTVTTWKLQDPDYTPSEVQKMGGWASIRMLDTYGKITDAMVNKKRLVLEAKQKKDKAMIEKLKKDAKHDNQLAKLMAMHGMLKDTETKDLLGTQVCPRCEQENLSNADFCSKCWLPLKVEFIEAKEKMISKHLQLNKPISKELAKEVLKEMIRDGEISL